jgi:hypothetical protein
MNWKKFILLGCVVPCVLRSRLSGAPMRGSMARMPMQRGPMRNSAFGFHRFNDGDFDRDDRFHRFHHHHNFNDIIVFDNFGFPVFPPPPFRPF